MYSFIVLLLLLLLFLLNCYYYYYYYYYIASIAINIIVIVIVTVKDSVFLFFWVFLLQQFYSGAIIAFCAKCVCDFCGFVCDCTFYVSSLLLIAANRFQEQNCKIQQQTNFVYRYCILQDVKMKLEKDKCQNVV